MRGMDIALADNTKIARSDTPPALYVWSGSANKWQPIITAYTMPSAFQTSYGTNAAVGCWEARICPSNTSKFYMLYCDAAWVSTNSGGTWTQLTNFPAVTFDANGTGANANYKMAVDPINDAICFAGPPGVALQKTVSSGAAWSATSLTAAGSGTQGTAVAYDPSVAASGGVSQGIFALVDGLGVYRSTNGGTSWTELNTSNMPTTFYQMACDQNGKLWVADGSHITTWTSAGGWVVNSLTDAPGPIAIDPNNPLNVAASSSSGRTYLSTNGGGAWTTAVPITTTYDGTGDAPWIDLGPIAGYNGTQLSGGPSNGSYTPSMGAFAFDNASVLYVSEGFGVLKSASPFASPNTAITFQGFSRGLEALDTTCIIHPPNGNPVGTAWDLPIWNFPNYVSNPSAYPSYYGPDEDFYGLMPNAGVNFVRGWHLEYASSTPNPPFLTAETALGGFYSSNGGVNWTPFADQSPFAALGWQGGAIASSSPENHVAFIVTAAPYYTINNGAKWTVSPIAVTSASYNNSTGLVTLNLASAPAFPVAGSPGAGTAATISGLADTPYTVSSGTYNNSTGLVTLTLSSVPSFSSGKNVTVGVTGSGTNLGQLDGVFTGTVSGSNVTFTVAAGLNTGSGVTAISITGGSVDLIANLNGLQGLASVSGSTITYNAPAGLGTLAITGGEVYGSTWTLCAYTGNQFTGGLQPNVFVCADRVNAGTFYIYSPGDGFYYSTNQGETFTKNYSLNVQTGLPKFKAVPGNAGHVFWTPGVGLASIPQTAAQLYWSINANASSGVAYNILSDFNSIFGFGFGAVAGGQSYPTIYMAAYRISTTVVGVYMCQNFNPATGAGTWTLLTNSDGTPLPQGWFAPISDVAGDPAVSGRCCISYVNGGFKRYA